MAFPDAVAEELLVNAARHCCLCREYKGTKIELHHIVPVEAGGTDDFENGIPLCFDCHAEVLSYNEKHPRGRRFRPSELKRLRDEWFKIAKAAPPRKRSIRADRSTRVSRSSQSNSIEKLRLMDERLQAVVRDWNWRGTPKPMIDTFGDLTLDEKAALFDRVYQLKKGRPADSNPYRL